MSYSIEYNKQIFYVQNEQKEKTYFLLIRQGDNNVYDYNNVRVKNWCLAEVGSDKDLWKTIGSRLGALNGGGLQKAVGAKTRYYTEEEYIKEYRSKFKNAKPLSGMLERFSVNAEIYIRDVFTNQDDVEIQQVLIKLIKEYEMYQVGSYYYDSSLVGYNLKIQDVGLLEYLLVNMPRGYKQDYHSNFKFHKY